MRTAFHIAKLPATRKAGISLVECVVSMLIIGTMLVAAIHTVGASRMAQFSESQRQQGYILAEALLTEIVNQSYEDAHDNPNAPGPTSTESATGNRSLFNDVNDYYGWTASPPQRKDGTAVPDATGWRETITITYLDPGSYANTNGRDHGISRIVVRMTSPQGKPIELTTIRTRTLATPEACCLANGACRLFPPSDCADAGGTSLGSGSNCWAQECADGLVGYWRFNDGGATATDEAWNHDGILRNGPTYVAAPSGSGTALQFDGTDDYVDIPHDSVLSLSTGVTICAWIYKDTNSGTDTIVNKGSSGSNSNYAFSTVGNALTFSFYNGQLYEYACTTTITTRAWTQVAVVYDDAANCVKFYTGGAARNSVSCTASLLPNSESLLIGWAAAANLFHGRIDNLRIYKRPLAADEIAAVFTLDQQ